eukprot:3728576-Amphidinium_carterae.3
MDQVYKRTKDILFHRLETLLHNLLGPHAEQLDALYDSCVQLIDSTMAEYPAIMYKYIRSFPFHVSTRPSRATIGEFEMMCRRFDLDTPWQFEEYNNFESFEIRPLQQPVLLLRKEQIPVIKTAISHILGKELTEVQNPIRAYSTATRTELPAPISPTLVYTEENLSMRVGGGKRPCLSSQDDGVQGVSPNRSSSSSGDHAPLTSLLQADSAQSSGEATPSSCSLGPQISYYAKFVGGRTPYGQVLWPNMTWQRVQDEMNRAVRRKKSLWWMFVNGVPLDPQAIVPAPPERLCYIQGSLHSLTAPLNFEFLRSIGGLCAPTGPTHLGVWGTPAQAQEAASQHDNVDSPRRKQSPPKRTNYTGLVSQDYASTPDPEDDSLRVIGDNVDVDAQLGLDEVDSISSKASSPVICSGDTSVATP